MSLSADRVNHRRSKIIEVLSKQNLTTKEIAQAIGASYHTVRNDMIVLVEDGKVSVTPETRDGGGVFRTGRVRPMPLVYHKASNQTLPLTAIVDSYGKNPHDSASARAALDIPAIATELFYMLALSVDISHPNSDTLESSNPKIRALRTRLTTDVLHLESILSIAKDMLKDENLWTAAGLEAIGGDSLFDANRVIATYENVLQSKQSNP